MGCRTLMACALLWSVAACGESTVLEADAAELDGATADASLQDAAPADAGSADLGGDAAPAVDAGFDAGPGNSGGACTISSDRITLGEGSSCTIPASVESQYGLIGFTGDSVRCEDGRVSLGGITGGSVTLNGLTIACAD